MDERERNITDAFIAMREFNTQNAADYANLTDAAANFTILEAVIDALETYGATETSGVGRRAVQGKSVVSAAIRRKMKDIARTARALDIDDEGFRRLFSVPDGKNHQKLLAAAREFASETANHQANFTRLGLPSTFIEELNEDIADLEATANLKAGAQSAKSGAVAGIDAEIERGMRSAKILNAMMQNVYRNNPIKLAEWTRARHIRKISRRTPAAEPPTPTA